MALYRPLVLNTTGDIVTLPADGVLEGTSSSSSSTPFAGFDLVDGEVIVTYNPIFNISLVDGEIIVGLT